MGMTVADIRRRKQAEQLHGLHQQASLVLADAVLDLGMADDVLALTDAEWLERRNGDDPYWRAIGRDAVRLSPP